MEEIKFHQAKCTNHCGFMVTGTRQYCESLYEDHKHQEDLESTRWYNSFFSYWGLLIFFVACIFGYLTLRVFHPYLGS